MATDISALFGALADDRRRAILDLLRGGTLTVNRIAEEFSVSRPAISRHLRVLREAGLVREEKRGRERFYELDPTAVGEAVEHLKPYLARAPRKRKPSQPKRKPSQRPKKPTTAKTVPKRSEGPDGGWRCW